jgi:hypothetical protein
VFWRYPRRPDAIGLYDVRFFSVKALLRQHLEPNRKELENAARKFKISARQERFREAGRNSLAKLIDEFLTEAADREVSRATERLDADVEALLKLGLWVADLRSR